MIRTDSRLKDLRSASAVKIQNGGKKVCGRPESTSMALWIRNSGSSTSVDCESTNSREAQLKNFR